nr:long-chain-alcohol oxidase FAO1-like [Aegilops tauschii subsp. strangulata]
MSPTRLIHLADFGKPPRAHHTKPTLQARAAAQHNARDKPSLLWTVRRDMYTHGFPPQQMEALRAICGALIPSLPGQGEDPHVTGGKDLDHERFYLASGADDAIPEEVAELAVKRCPWEATTLLRAVLWALSTKAGTLVLCGRLCISDEIRRFAHMPLERKEEALKKWSKASWFLLPTRIAFVIFKMLCQYVFYTKVDENYDNPSWKAIGYGVKKVEEQWQKRPRRPRPLDKGVLNTKELNDQTFLRSVTEKGLAVKPGTNQYHTVECDVVIAGSGCGGGVAAAVLASAGLKVVVVEKGDYFIADDYSGIEGPSMEQLYENGGILFTSDATTALLSGATVGGGSAVNWSASIRTPEDVLQEWSQHHGLGLFRSSRYEQAMDAVCKRLGVTARCREEGFQNKVLRRGCKALGIPVQAVPRNSPEGHYCGSCGYGCPTGEKRGTDTTWLVDAVAHGAVILTGCNAHQFILEKSTRPGKAGRSSKCTGLVAKCMNSGITKKLRIMAKASISACGALMTPPLLRKSGLKNKHIGRNLYLHPASMAWGYFPEDTVTGKCYQGGVITSMHRVTERTVIETPALAPGMFATVMPWVSGRDMKHRMLRYARTAHLVALVRDRGQGFVDGVGRVRFTPSPDDTRELCSALRRALRILVAAGAAEVGIHRSDGLRLGCKGVGDEDLEAFLAGVTIEKGPLHFATDKWGILGSAHQMGSCRMASNNRDGAVDSSGESWEAEGLYVSDASVLPTAIGINPMITIQSVAYCISHDIAMSFVH